MAEQVNKNAGLPLGGGGGNFESTTPLPTREMQQYFGTSYGGGSPLQRLRAGYQQTAQLEAAAARAPAPTGADSWIPDELRAWSVNQDPITRALGWTKTRGPKGTTYRTKGGRDVSLANVLLIVAGGGIAAWLLLRK